MPSITPVVYLLDGSRALTGAFVGARNIARALSGKARVVLIIAEDADIGLEETRDFAAVERLPILHLRRSIWAVMRYLPGLLAASIRLRRSMRQAEADILIVNDFYLMQGAVARLLGFRGRMMTWVRINPAAFGRLSTIWLWAVKKTSDRVVSVSRYIDGLLPDGVATDLLYDGVDRRFEATIPGEPQPGRNFVFIGHYIPGKGQEIAVEALALVVSEFPDAHITFHGGDMGLAKNREFRASLEERVRVLGIREHVTFGTFVADPRSVLVGKYAAINLSRSESFSMTVLEAAACGLAVIATRSGGPEEIIENGRTGLLIQVDDVGACADAMLRLCREPDTARRMGLAGRARVLSEFSQTAFQDRLIRLLELD